MKSMGRRTYLISLGISILFTLFILSGQWSRTEGLSKGYYAAQGIACLLLFFAGTLGLFWIRDRFGWKLRTEDGQDFMEKRGIGVKREYLFALLAILLLYLPAFLAVFPGIFGYDGPGEILQFFSDREPVTAHHPLAHELLLVGCFYLGHFLFGDYNLGLMIYSIVQSVTVAACAAYAVIWLRRRRIAFGYRVTALLFFGLNPLIQMLAYNTTKDTLYGAFFLLVFLLLLDLLETWNRRRAIGFVAAAILMCLFRNQGYYILAFVCLGVFVFLRKRGGKVCGILLISAVVGWFFMGPLISILQIPKGDPREMLSVPMQQMAAVWKADQADLIAMEDGDRELLEELIDPACLDQYLPDCSDPVKSGFHTEALRERPLEYLQLYLRLGSANTRIYLRAFGQMLSGVWDITQYGEYRYLLYTNTFPENNVCNIQRSGLLKEYEYYLINVADHLDQMVGLRWVLSPVLPAWLMFLNFGVALREKNKKNGCALLLLLGQWGIMLLSPIVLVRYAFPMIACVPTLVYLLLGNGEKRTTEDIGG